MCLLAGRGNGWVMASYVGAKPIGSSKRTPLSRPF
jgi:hypothetical protein